MGFTVLKCSSFACMMAFASAGSITVDTSKPVRTKSPGLYGCHIDPGYNHQWQQFTSNLLFNSEFETYTMPGGQGTYEPHQYDNTSTTCDGTSTAWGKFGLESSAGTLEECESACSQNSLCKFLQFQPARSKCHLYQSCSTSRECNKACDRTLSHTSGGNVETTYWHTDNGTEGSYTSEAPFNGLQAATLESEGKGLINTGFHSQGLSLEAGKSYEGYVYVRATNKATLKVALETNDGKQLASQTLQHGGGGAWQRLDFGSLVPSEATSCANFEWGMAPLNCYSTLQQRPGHACWKCGGSFAIRLVKGDSVDIDAAWLQPGEWGRFAGLPVIKRTVEMLQNMKVDVLRLGGTHIKTDRILGGDDAKIGSAWKNYRGPAETRSPAVQVGSGIDNALWGPQLRSRHFAFFETADLAEAMGAQLVLTMTHLDTPVDVGDLVDYMFGETSDWAEKRIEDGRDKPYNVDTITFELGNEINNTNFAAQAMAMEARANKLGLGKRLRYAAPLQNICENANDNPPGKCNIASMESTRQLGSQVLLDIHTNDGLDRVDLMTKLVGEFDTANLSVRFAIWETNTALLHNQQRALMEAKDLAANERNREAIRLDTRTMSFCTELSGHDDLWSKRHGDQGAIFVAPNQTWGQPPYHAHTMLADAWQPIDVDVTMAGVDELDIVASWDGKSLVTLRVVNSASTAATASLQLMAGEGEMWPASAAEQAVLAADLEAVNPATSPDAVTPVRSAVDLSKPLTFPAYSVTTLSIHSKLLETTFV